MKPQYAVLTGDFVKSRELSVEQLQGAIGTLRQAVATFEERYPGSVRGGVAVFRGDSWQLLLSRPELALRCALYIRARLYRMHKLQTKLGIGVGDVAHIDEGNITASTGPAFEHSGACLNRLEETNPSRRRYLMDVTGQSPDAFFPVAMHFLDRVAQSWTQPEAYAVSGALLGHTQEAIAAGAEEPLSQQNIAKALLRAEWQTVEECVQTWESISEG